MVFTADFRRAFFLSLSAVIILIFFALGLSFVCGSLAESGFSSGEFFTVEHRGDELFAEVFGKSFSADVSSFGKAVKAFKIGAVFLPVPVQLVIRLVPFLF